MQMENNYELEDEMLPEYLARCKVELEVNTLNATEQEQM